VVLLISCTAQAGLRWGRAVGWYASPENEIRVPVPILRPEAFIKLRPHKVMVPPVDPYRNQDQRAANRLVGRLGTAAGRVDASAGLSAGVRRVEMARVSAFSTARGPARGTPDTSSMLFRNHKELPNLGTVVYNSNLTTGNEFYLPTVAYLTGDSSLTARTALMSIEYPALRLADAVF
jgi:hypothetical protein